MKKPKMTVLLFDAEYKDSAPALLSLKNQTIIDDVEVVWVEFYKNIFNEVYKYDFIKKVRLNIPKEEIYNMSYCFNMGLRFAVESGSDLFCIADACLWFPPDCLENIYNFHRKQYKEKNMIQLSFNVEWRGSPSEHRHLLTENYFSKRTDIPDINKYCGSEVGSNTGAMTTAPTKCLQGINGFDLHHIPGVLTDRNGVALAVAMLKNKYNMDSLVVPDKINQSVYHAWHPIHNKPTVLHKKRKQLLLDGTTRANLGLEFITNNFSIEKKGDIYECTRH